MTKEDKLKSAVGPYLDKCDGYGNLGSSGIGYVLGVFLGVGKAKMELGHKGSKLLDEINAFDIAETDGPYLGQINMSIVSSFCGPQGLIWGYDMAKAENLYALPNRKTFPKQVTHKDKKLEVFPIEPLVEATKSLFGTVGNLNYNLMPGAHVPCAGKSVKISEPGMIYAGVAIGIPEDRSVSACLLMEDVGVIPLEDLKSSEEQIMYEDKIRENLAKSILYIGENQKITYEKVFVGIKSIAVSNNEVGCALVACPYLTLAQNVIPASANGEKDYKKLIDMSILEWNNVA